MKNADKRGVLTIISSIFLLLVLSCESDHVFQKMERIEGNAWNAEDTVSLNFEVQDTSRPHDFYLKIRNNTNYPYRNIYFFLEMEFPNGKHWMDTVECKLADGKGNWKGSGIGNIKDHSFLFMRKRFPVKGAYRFKIVHAMRKEHLRGIEDVGLGIERISEKQR